MSARTFLAFLACLIVGGSLGWIGSSDVGAGRGQAVCEEDQACWSCSTMGNRICGKGSK